MKSVLLPVAFATALLTGCAPATESSAPEPEPAIDPAATIGVTYPGRDVPRPEVVFENEYVIVQQLLTQPGVWSGVHGHAGNQFGVSFGAGVTQTVTDSEETTTTRAADEFFWIAAVESHNHRQTSEEPRYVYVVTIKRSPSYVMGTDPAAVTFEGYPNDAGELVIDNEMAIVRRFDTEPEYWTGLHSHDGNEMAIMLTDATVMYEVGEERREVSFAARDTIWTDAGVEHDHGNTGDSTMSFYVIKLR